MRFSKFETMNVHTFFFVVVDTVASLHICPINGQVFTTVYVMEVNMRQNDRKIRLLITRGRIYLFVYILTYYIHYLKHYSSDFCTSLGESK